MNKKLYQTFIAPLILLSCGLNPSLAAESKAKVAKSLKLDPARIEQAVSYANSLPRIRSLIIIKDGKTLVEEYFNGATPDRATNIKSVSKSILSALVGIALREGYLKDPDEKIDNYIGDLFPPNTVSAKRDITFRHLLTMSSGLDSASRKNYWKWQHSPSWVSYALSMKMVAAPGSKPNYSTADSHLLSAVLTRAINGDLLEFADKHLFKPVKIKVEKWEKDPQGFYFGGNNMYITPRDLAKFGQLILNNGRLKRKKIIPQDWIEESTVGHAPPYMWSPFSVKGYGYLWWLLEVGSHNAIAAWGLGGQYLMIFPDLKMVIVITSDPEAGVSHEYLTELARLLEDYIL